MLCHGGLPCRPVEHVVCPLVQALARQLGGQCGLAVNLGADPEHNLRPHAAHGGQPPAVGYFNAIETDQQVQAVA